MAEVAGGIKSRAKAIEVWVMDQRPDQCAPAQPQPEDLRRAGRFIAAGVTCQLGEVTDLSARGMRIRHKGFGWYRVGETVKLKLDTLDIKLQVHARICWIRKVRLGVYEFGLEFMEMSPEELSMLWDLAFSVNRFVSGTQLRYVRRPR